MVQIEKKLRKYLVNCKKITFLLIFLLFINFMYGEELIGYASWYGPKFHGNKTANGEVYDMYKLTAAHKTLPFNTLVKVTNLKNQKQVVVRINDRGPFIKNRIIDLSYGAAKKIGLIKEGTSKVKLEILDKNKRNVNKLQYYIYLASFTHKSSANKFKRKFIDKFNKVKIIYKQNYLVLLGPYKNTNIAGNMLERLNYYKYEGKIINGSHISK